MKGSAERTQEELEFLNACLLSISYFQEFEKNLEHDTKMEVMRELTFKFYKKGDFVFHAGDLGRHFFMLLKGSVFVLIKNRNEPRNSIQSTPGTLPTPRKSMQLPERFVSPSSGLKVETRGSIDINSSPNNSRKDQYQPLQNSPALENASPVMVNNELQTSMADSGSPERISEKNSPAVFNFQEKIMDTNSDASSTRGRHRALAHVVKRALQKTQSVDAPPAVETRKSAFRPELSDQPKLTPTRHSLDPRRSSSKRNQRNSMEIQPTSSKSSLHNEEEEPFISDKKLKTHYSRYTHVATLESPNYFGEIALEKSIPRYIFELIFLQVTSNSLLERLRSSAEKIAIWRFCEQ